MWLNLGIISASALATDARWGCLRQHYGHQQPNQSSVQAASCCRWCWYSGYYLSSQLNGDAGRWQSIVAAMQSICWAVGLWESWLVRLAAVTGVSTSQTRRSPSSRGPAFMHGLWHYDNQWLGAIDWRNSSILQHQSTANWRWAIRKKTTSMYFRFD